MTPSLNTPAATLGNPTATSVSGTPVNRPLIGNIPATDASHSRPPPVVPNALRSPITSHTPSTPVNTGRVNNVGVTPTGQSAKMPSMGVIPPSQPTKVRCRLYPVFI